MCFTFLVWRDIMPVILNLFSLIPAWVRSEEACLVPRPLFIFSCFWNSDGLQGPISVCQFAATNKEKGFSMLHKRWHDGLWRLNLISQLNCSTCSHIQFPDQQKQHWHVYAEFSEMTESFLLRTAWLSTMLSLMRVERRCFFQSWGWKWHKEWSISSQSAAVVTCGGFASGVWSGR